MLCVYIRYKPYIYTQHVRLGKHLTKRLGHDDLLRLRDELRLTAREVMLEVMYVSVEKSQTFVLKYETMLQEHGQHVKYLKHRY